MPVSHAPGKKSSLFTKSGGVTSSAPVLANSPIQVVPSIVTSGVCWPAIAAAILLCAPSQGTAVTVTLASGFSFMKSSASTDSFSPSVPIAQMVMLPDALPCETSLPSSALSSPESRPQAEAAGVPAVTAASSTVRLVGRVMVLLRLHLVGAAAGPDHQPGGKHFTADAGRGARDQLVEPA